MDDDDFLYGDAPPPSAKLTTPAPVSPIVPVAPQPDLFSEAHEEPAADLPFPVPPQPLSAPQSVDAGSVTPSLPEDASETPAQEQEQEGEEQDDEDGEGEEDEESEDDIEFIMEPASRSLDLRFVSWNSLLHDYTKLTRL